jgi:hypothetical protein
MGHSAAMYRVRIKERNRDEYRLFGDFDEADNDFLPTVADYMSDFVATSADGERSVVCTSATPDGRNLAVLLEHGQTGIGADIIGPDGVVRLRQHPDYSQNLLCGALFDFPLTSSHGWLCVHINNRLWDQGLTRYSPGQTIPVGLSRSHVANHAVYLWFRSGRGRQSKCNRQDSPNRNRARP